MSYFTRNKGDKTFESSDFPTKVSVEKVNNLPVWRNRWFLRLVCLENPLEQIWHLKGQEPECTYMCDLRSPGVGNDLLHKLHLCGLSWKRGPNQRRLREQFGPLLSLRLSRPFFRRLHTIALVTAHLSCLSLRHSLIIFFYRTYCTGATTITNVWRAETAGTNFCLWKRHNLWMRNVGSGRFAFRFLFFAAHYSLR